MIKQAIIVKIVIPEDEEAVAEMMALIGQGGKRGEVIYSPEKASTVHISTGKVLSTDLGTTAKLIFEDETDAVEFRLAWSGEFA